MQKIFAQSCLGSDLSHARLCIPSIERAQQPSQAALKGGAKVSMHVKAFFQDGSELHDSAAMTLA